MRLWRLSQHRNSQTCWAGLGWAFNSAWMAVAGFEGLEQAVTVNVVAEMLLTGDYLPSADAFE